jgi:hypothetical protein
VSDTVVCLICKHPMGADCHVEPKRCPRCATCGHMPFAENCSSCFQSMLKLLQQAHHLSTPPGSPNPAGFFAIPGNIRDMNARVLNLESVLSGMHGAAVAFHNAVRIGTSFRPSDVEGWSRLVERSHELKVVLDDAARLLAKSFVIGPPKTTERPTVGDVARTPEGKCVLCLDDGLVCSQWLLGRADDSPRCHAHVACKVTCPLCKGKTAAPGLDGGKYVLKDGEPSEIPQLAESDRVEVVYDEVRGGRSSLVGRAGRVAQLSESYWYRHGPEARVEFDGGNPVWSWLPMLWLKKIELKCSTADGGHVECDHVEEFEKP